jgi:hypothetical protein
MRGTIGIKSIPDLIVKISDSSNPAVKGSKDLDLAGGINSQRLGQDTLAKIADHLNTLFRRFRPYEVNIMMPGNGRTGLKRGRGRGPAGEDGMGKSDNATVISLTEGDR